MRISLSTSRLRLEFQADGDRLRLSQFSSGGNSWLNSGSTGGLFAVYANGQRHDADTLSFRGWATIPERVGIQHGVARFAATDFEVEHHVVLYDESALIEQWQVIRASAEATVEIARLDSFSLDIPAAEYDLLHFNSAWGQEFEPVRARLSGEVILETHAGRSSKGMHPLFALMGAAGVLTGSVAWSGNWVCRFEPQANGGYRLSGGLHDWNFGKTLGGSPESMESAHVVLALGSDLNDTAQQYARVGRRWRYPHNALSNTLPVEWNHWWSYEDADISEAVFLANVEAAARMGVEICTLDAGWFGASDAAAPWYDVRGDWESVNVARFPHGIRVLADAAHAAGMKFGLWCEIEALGRSARLAETHPELAARRDGVALNEVCFGSPAVQDWAYRTLSRLIREYACDWIKLDFNSDPGAGCNRTDHGHGAGDGLRAHVEGYYRVLERIRTEFPQVVLENCSSGGLRIDLGMMRQTHLTFLSDCDWAVHNLQVFWGATLMLAPEVCLHWSFSEWRPGNGPPQQNFNPRDPALTRQQFDFYTRTAMLGAFGFSQKLPQLPEWVAQRLTQHVTIYQEHVRRFVRDADLYRLTDQPRRNGQGDRWCAFQYRLPDDSEHLLFVFRLPGAEGLRSIRLMGLQSDRLYQIAGFEGEWHEAMIGRNLMESGILFSDLLEEESALLRLF